MPESKAQVRLAHAILSGKAKKKSMPRSVAEEIVGKMHGHKMSKLPEYAHRKK